jgi:hypothetical protein
MREMGGWNKLRVRSEKRCVGFTLYFQFSSWRAVTAGQSDFKLWRGSIGYIANSTRLKRGERILQRRLPQADDQTH